MRTPYALLFAASLIGTDTIYAQTLDNGNLSPQIGENFTNNVVPYVAQGPGGANQTWNFASLPNGTPQSYSYQTPASTGYAGSFPGANLAANLGGGSFGFYTSSAAGLDVNGVHSAATSTTISYQNPERILSYPCSNGSTWNDNFSANFTTGGYQALRSGTISGLADGFGTLIMPYGTVTNVLRVRTIEDYTDDITDLYTIEYLFTNYYFYKPGTHAPLLGIYDQITTIFGEVTPSQSASWLSTGPTGMEEALRNAIGIEIFPNPASTHTSVVLSSGGGTLRLELTDAMGRLVRSDSHSGLAMGIERFDLDVSALPAGLYQIRVSAANGEQGVQRLVVE